MTAMTNLLMKNTGKLRNLINYSLLDLLLTNFIVVPTPPSPSLVYR